VRPRECLAALTPTLRREVVSRILALDPNAVQSATFEREELAATLLDDGEAIRRAFLALTPTGRTIVAALSVPRTPFDLTAIVLARHGALTGEIYGNDQALADAVRGALARWPVLARSAQASLVLFEGVALVLEDLIAEARAVARSGGGGPATTLVLGPRACAFAMTPGLLMQRGARLTQDGELHRGDAAKLERLLPHVGMHTLGWTGAGVITVNESGASRFHLDRAMRLLAAPAETLALEQIVGGWIDPIEAQLISVALAAREGDILDLADALAHIAAPNSGGQRFARGDHTFRVLFADPKCNWFGLPCESYRVLSGRSAGDFETQRSWVKSDFEVVLSTETPLVDALVLGCSAELLHVENVARLRLTQASVRKARALGVTHELLARVLERVSKRPLPVGVATALREWSADVMTGDLTVAIVLTLSGSSVQLDRAHKALGALVLRRPEPGTFFLRRVPTPKQLEALRASGVLARNAIPSRVGKQLEALTNVDDAEDQTEDDAELSSSVSADEEIAASDAPTAGRRGQGARVRFVDQSPRCVDIRGAFARDRLEQMARWVAHIAASHAVRDATEQRLLVARRW
jgi:hypothetical protein